MSSVGFNVLVANNRGREGLYSAALILCFDSTLYHHYFSAGLILTSNLALASSDITGNVNSVNVNKQWSGVFIQLVNLSKFEPGSACESSWAFMEISDEYTKHFMSVAMSSKATGEKVRIATGGCMAATLGQVPKILWLDY